MSGVGDDYINICLIEFSGKSLGFRIGKTEFKCDIPTLDPIQLSQTLFKRIEAAVPFRITCSESLENPYPFCPVG